ncbi:N-(5'-phosphoribosyl)anthranilate isomerase [Candidatus Xiphinematobacter sp. Idaho Grape]|uniref:phosphoribosylanthranilate isomerase n=1 Tax=Candidatus Xiphinematobacter sp. Idaho Grape TaxID=1704307 RepID=UPI000706099D|nr:phosphoribosylanthranilate isomerase [Candidatus Xiphinematobacter sp. Idaho Grape]ALJ56808.1 N-(5'-phosphoribosyl)anthranilate isomerase [Candidatus Xiphinematobacter sp. Idaho Grape]
MPLFSHSQLQIKICGLKTSEEAKVAIHAGADALGFNFFPSSKRFLSPGSALSLLSTLPRKVARVAVVVNPTSAELQFLLASCAFDAIQFHGDESPEFCRNSGFPVWIKAIRVSSYELTERQVRSFPTPYLLLDADSPSGVYGGTGMLIDLSLAKRVIHAFPHKRFLLAGGLRPENVRKAVSMVHPFAVDVSSGVEDDLGYKSASKIQALIKAAREDVVEHEKL